MLVGTWTNGLKATARMVDVDHISLHTHGYNGKYRWKIGPIGATERGTAGTLLLTLIATGSFNLAEALHLTKFDYVSNSKCQT